MEIIATYYWNGIIKETAALKCLEAQIKCIAWNKTWIRKSRDIAFLWWHESVTKLLAPWLGIKHSWFRGGNLFDPVIKALVGEIARYFEQYFGIWGQTFFKDLFLPSGIPVLWCEHRLDFSKKKKKSPPGWPKAVLSLLFPAVNDASASVL